MNEHTKEIIIILGTVFFIGLLMGIVTQRAFGELEYIDFSKPIWQHIHVKVVGIDIPPGIGVTPANQCPPEFPPLPDVNPYSGCLREIHTHLNDNILHMESTTPKNFTLRDFFQFWFQDNWGDQVPVQLSNVTINGKSANIDTPLKDSDLVSINL
jgi:hypothetical protein